MTLYAIPFTCSFAVRLALAERGTPHEVRWMRRFEHVLDDGTRFDDAINPKGKVPALTLPDGELLTEIPAVLAHVDAMHATRPDAERRRLLESLCYVATELHKAVGFPLFDPATPPATRDDVLARVLPPVLDHLADRLAAHPTLLGGDHPSVADFYLFWALLLLRFRFREHSQRPALDAYVRRLSSTPWIATLVADERSRLSPTG